MALGALDFTQGRIRFVKRLKVPQDVPHILHIYIYIYLFYSLQDGCRFRVGTRHEEVVNYRSQRENAKLLRLPYLVLMERLNFLFGIWRTELRLAQGRFQLSIREGLQVGVRQIWGWTEGPCSPCLKTLVPKAYLLWTLEPESSKREFDKPL